MGGKFIDGLETGEFSLNPQLRRPDAASLLQAVTKLRFPHCQNAAANAPAEKKQ